MFKKLLIVSAVSAAFAASPSFAQQQGGAQVSDQQLAQERVNAPGSPIFVSTAGVRQIQQALNQRGFDVGNVDGQWNNRTAQAAANFQQTRGLEPTGTLTLALVNSLGLGEQVINAQGGGGLQGQRWGQEAVVGQGTPLRISPAGVRQIQQALNQRGYDVGNVDGIWNRSTANAAANFQQANRLEPNGKPDVNLITALGLTQQILSGAGEQQGRGGDMQWAQETVRGQGAILWASPATVRQIQQAMNRAGYDVGNVDGQWGQQTSQAVQNFQRAQGLEPTGTLTTSLLANVGAGNWMAGRGGQQQGGQQQAGVQVGGQQSAGGGQGGQQQSSGGAQILQQDQQQQRAVGQQGQQQ
jgi:peptidoglycan hydrolase-like protein with peptidoglycan-binding domain